MAKRKSKIVLKDFDDIPLKSDKRAENIVQMNLKVPSEVRAKARMIATQKGISLRGMLERLVDMLVEQGEKDGIV